ncbi:MAG TPA: bifunctional (p)ppGpp synthetase/guanosine-3',5'-bis(diphosphate) 3'-pyrophosphohydrolase [Gammaproteobacteria bacterium]|nr:bifunctional (p)ppGpp synthetase/guanosine-3',5'-bis(diphosphate) 3'-pyrophosphohydrolase [Gammaproteobacteria bacterium]
MISLETTESCLPQVGSDLLDKARALVSTYPPETNQIAARGQAVVAIVSELGLGSEAMAAGLLLAFVEASLLDPLAVERSLGSRIAHLIQAARHIAILKEYRKATPPGAQADKLRNMLLTVVEDPRVVVIRLADQLYQLRTAKQLPPEMRRALGQETLEIFAPLAGRLGIWQFKWELEDLAFRYLEPETYQRIALLLEQRRAVREGYIKSVVARLNEELHRAGIEGQISGRPKHIYSIYTKMKNKHMDFHQIFDVLAVRILVHQVADCYAALGLAHSLWQQIPEEFDDYIAKPKANQYQSLHTAVIGPEGQTLEVQIRTLAMHRHAELGVAAHWRYKEKAREAGLEQRIVWLRGFLEQRDEEREEVTDLIERFKAEAFLNYIYVLTPQGQVIDLPVGSTPLDFAYAVHTEIGHHCRGAKVDGLMVPLTQRLQNGQQVEILTTRGGTPSRDWLNPTMGYLQSLSARAKVRRWFKQQDHEQHIAQGRAILERERRRLGVTGSNLGRLAKQFGYKQPDDLFAALGHAQISLNQLDHALREPRPPQPINLPASGLPLKSPALTHGEVHVLGVSNLLIRMAGCCKPMPNEPITGYVTQGQGIAIHRQDCYNLRQLARERPERLIDVAWGTATAQTYPVDILVEAHDRRGLLRDVSEAVTGEQVNILAVNTLSDRATQTARMCLTLEIGNAEQLERVLKHLLRVSGMVQARRKI